MSHTELSRRQLLALAGAWAASAETAPADINLRISEITADLGHGHSVKTLAYKGQIPGPVLRMTEGKPAVIDVVNETRQPEMVHWHGFRPRWMARTKRARRWCRGEIGADIPSRRSPRARAGITRMPWRVTICASARTPASSEWW
ncbi:exported hypothetical protein [Candidatus Sulfopaludibacter sp. SbA3]|nr:exported hypothetical protein [Candidatus Sulfopaludibacter sp. SbA3]